MKRVKSGKVVGSGLELWKCLEEKAVYFLTRLFNTVLERENMPEDWRRSVVIIIIFEQQG